MADHNSYYCPKCRQATSIAMRARKEIQRGDAVIYEIGECNNCAQHFLVLRAYPSGKILGISPNALPKPVDPSIPSPTREDLEEAYKCQSAEAYRGAATMARRAMQNICLEKGAPKTREVKGKDDRKREVPNELVRQIDWLYEERIITADLKNWAHEIRLVGNAGAHPGDAGDNEPVTRQDAEDVLNLVEAFCQPLYVASEIYRKRHGALGGSTQELDP